MSTPRSPADPRAVPPAASAVVPHAVWREDRADGSVILTSPRALGPVARCTGDWLRRWAGEVPDRVFLAERSGAGWRAESYGATLQQVRAIAAGLLARGLDGTTPILILSGNGVDHGLLALAAQYVGIPIAPIAEQYALIPGAHDRLLHAIGLIRPAMAYAVDAGQFAEALRLDAFDGIAVVASRTAGAPRPVTPFADLLRGDGGVDVADAQARVGPGTLAKILMTSGSTAHPKGVLTSHRMLCVNQTQIADVLPLLRARPPRILDWLPWNHVFGGSHNFNMMLANGGSLYIDDGKPTGPGFARTLENLGLVAGTIALNVPVGFSMLVAALRADAALRRAFFADLDLMFYAGASLPAEVWEGLEGLAVDVRGAVPMMISSWGMTETAPAALMAHEPMGRAGAIGVPLPGVTAKLVPDAEGRYELRVAGPNVMAGYFNDPEKTAAAFDDEGFLITGDAVRIRRSATAEGRAGIRRPGVGGLQAAHRHLGAGGDAAARRPGASGGTCRRRGDRRSGPGRDRPSGVRGAHGAGPRRGRGRWGRSRAGAGGADRGAAGGGQCRGRGLVGPDRPGAGAGRAALGGGRRGDAQGQSQPASGAGAAGGAGGAALRRRRPGRDPALKEQTMVDISKVRAIDIHTHAEEPCGCHPDDGYDDLQATMAQYFRAPWRHPPTIPETAAHYREQNIAAVIFPVDSERETGYRRYRNEEVAELAAAHSDVLIPFASIDPHKGKAGVREARRLIADYGIKGFKFHPTMQGFYPNDRMAYGLYEAIAEAGAIALFHTGQTGVGSGMRGRQRDAAEILQSDVRRRRGGRLPRDEDHPRPSVVPLAGGEPRGRPAQTERLHRPSAAGRRSTFPTSLSNTAIRSCAGRCCSAPTGR